jgi:hypothetical protein
VNARGEARRQDSIERVAGSSRVAHFDRSRQDPICRNVDTDDQHPIGPLRHHDRRVTARGDLRSAIGRRRVAGATHRRQEVAKLVKVTG